MHHPPKDHQHVIINAFGVMRDDDNELNSKDPTRDIKSIYKRTSNSLTRYSRLGLDSHADMTCVGQDAHIIEHVHGQTCTVHPFHDSYNPKRNIKICNAAFAFDQSDGRTLILIVNQCLDFTNNMKHSLLCTNQVRSNGIIVEDVPIAIDITKQSRQAIIVPQDNSNNIHIPLLMHGPVPYIPIRKPTKHELNTCNQVTLTSFERWDPSLFLTSEDHVVNELVITYNDIQDDTGMNHLTINAMAKYASLIRNQTFHASSVRHSKKGEINFSYLSELWDIPLKVAKRTLDVTENFYYSSIHGPFTRRRRASHGRREHVRLSGNLSRFCTDTFPSNVISLRGNRYTQLYTNRANFTRPYHIKTKGDAGSTFHRFIEEVGIPSEILSDGAPELTLSHFGKTCQKYRILQTCTEPNSPWQNPAELSGGTIKRKVRRILKTTNAPIRLWDYCWDYVCQIRNYTAMDHIFLDGLTPHQKVTGTVPNISELIQYKWFDWIWYLDLSNPVRESLGKYLGPAEHCGEGYTSYILTRKGKVIVRSSVRPLSVSDENSTEVHSNMESFTKEMNSLIGNNAPSTMQSHSNYSDNPYENIFPPDQFDDENIEFFSHQNDHNDENLNDAPITQERDEHIGIELMLPVSGELKRGKVMSRKRSSTGHLIGTSNPNPILDTRIYEVQFDNGTYADYSTNVIMENLYTQADEYGNTTKIFKGISNHRSTPDAIPKSDGWVTLNGNLRKRRVTTKGWDLLVDWVDGTQSWIPLHQIKKSNPLETAEYAISRNIQDEPAFAWWVNWTIKRRKYFIKKLKSTIHLNNMKYGIKIPKSVEEAYQLDKQNKNDYWEQAINKELKRVTVAFKLLQDDEDVPIGSTKIPYHIIFDVKFDLSRKARLVAGGHKHKNVPAFETYSSVASRETIRLIFLIAALNDLSILAADIGNAYLNAPCKEKVHVECGAELFGKQNQGKIAVIVRALYGLKSAGASWRNHLSTMIQNQLNYKCCKADQDTYYKMMKDSKGRTYYAYLVVYVDDILSVDINPKIALDIIDSNFKLKKGSLGFPNHYLGTNIRKWKTTSLDGMEINTYAMGSETYVKEAIRICEGRMKDFGLTYPSSKPKMPFTSASYRPELDGTDECNTDMTTLYQNLIGICRWMCELGRIDILLEINLLSQYMVSPRIGHMRQLINIFAYLKRHTRSWIVINPERFEIDWIPINDEANPTDRAALLKSMYPDSDDPDPPNMPIPLGENIQLTCFCDANHAGNAITRRSQTGIIIYANMTPIQWISKKQNTVESSTFGSEFIALKQATEIIKGIRYKLKMLGVPLEGPARLMCDSQSVVMNSSFPESVLKKKHCSIAYHLVREAIAANVIHVYWERSKTNLADLFTKVLPPETRNHLISAMLN